MKPFARVPLALALLLLFSPLGALAQGLEEEEDLALAFGDKGTVTIATGAQQSLRRAPAVATVITAADIAAMGAVDLDEVMETVPGMHVARNGTTNNTALYVMRGIYNVSNPHMLMLQNGVPMTLMFLGNKGGVWGGLPVENIARIEVIRGPGSALYGADAYSGVINIITKTATDTPGTEVGARAGSFGAWDTWAQHGGKMGPIDVAAYLRIGGTDGFKKTIQADAQTLKDKTSGLAPASHAPGLMNVGKDAVDASLDLSYDKWRFRGGYKLRDNVELGAGVASSLDPTSHGKSERVTGDLSWIDPNISRDWGLGLTASYLHYADTLPGNLLLAPPGAKVGTTATLFPEGQIGGPNKWERQIRLSAFATYSGFDDHSVRAGIGHDDLNLYKTATYKNYTTSDAGVTTRTALMDYSEINPFMRPQRRKANYAYIQDEWNFSRDWTLTAGVRRDIYSDVGATNNPRLALVWDASQDVTAKLMTGRAFRAPSFNELYAVNNPVNKGNPALKPETNSTQEAAISWQARKDMQVNVNYFRYTMKNIIRAVGTATRSTYANSGDQKGKGYELESVWDISRGLRVSANFSHQSSIDDATQTDAGYAPHDHFYARGDWRLTSGWLLSPQINWVSDRRRASGDVRPAIADYTSVDLALRTEQSKGQWSFAASVRNLFNATILEPSLAPGTAIPNDLPQAGRSLYVQAVYKL